jgi:Fe-S-cluster formation regulator IscX/YfhJ
MSDFENIVSEIDDLKSKVDSRKVEICEMEERIGELNELLDVCVFDDDGMDIDEKYQKEEYMS